MSENLSKLDDSPTRNIVVLINYCKLLVNMQHKQDSGAPYATPVLCKPMYALHVGLSIGGDLAPSLGDGKKFRRPTFLNGFFRKKFNFHAENNSLMTHFYSLRAFACIRQTLLL